MSNPLVAAIPLAGGQPSSVTRQNIALAVALPLKDAAAVTAFNALNLASDLTPYPAVIYAGTVFDFDAADTTTAHDAPGGCITDASGRRYKRSVAVKPDWIVLDKDLTVPPGSPAAGDAYFVATAATGAWAGHDRDQAVYGARGWTFREVDEGHMLYVADEASFYHMPASGVLTKGLGDLALASSSIEARHLAFKMGMVVQAAQTAPPGSPADRVAYLVISPATGAWAGQENKVAEFDSALAAWLFHTARTGDIVMDVAAGFQKRFAGSAWVQAAVSPPVTETALVRRTTTATINPNTSADRLVIVTAPLAALAGQKIRVRGFFASSGAALSVLGVYVDNETAPRVELEIVERNFCCQFVPSDTALHDISVRCGGTVSQLTTIAIGAWAEFEVIA